MGKSGGIEGEGIERCDYLVFFLLVVGQWIVVSVFENEYVMLEYFQCIQIVSMGGGKIDILFIVYFMQFWCLNQLVYWFVLWCVLNYDWFSIV